jgi:hypothetical protein
MVALALLLLDDLDSYDEIDVNYLEFEKKQVEATSLTKFYKFK